MRNGYHSPGTGWAVPCRANDTDSDAGTSMPTPASVSAPDSVAFANRSSSPVSSVNSRNSSGSSLSRTASSYAGRTSSDISSRRICVPRSLVSLVAGCQLLRTIPRCLDCRNEGGAYGVAFELADRVGRGAGGRGDRLAQLHRVLALAQHQRRAERGLHDEVGGDR